LRACGSKHLPQKKTSEHQKRHHKLRGFSHKDHAQEGTGGKDLKRLERLLEPPEGERGNEEKAGGKRGEWGKGGKPMKGRP